MDSIKLKEYCDKGFNSRKIAEIENLSKSAIRYWLKKYQLTTKGWFSYNEETLKQVISESISYNEVLVKLNRNTSSNSYRVLKRAINTFNVDISHFLNKRELMKLKRSNGGYNHKENSEIFIINGNTSRSLIKNRLINDNLIEYKCNFCGQNDMWRNKKFSLILDHINGVNNDNRLENLRFLCPNCNATLETHCKGSIGLIEKSIKVKKQRKISDRTKCRKVKERPTLTELNKMLETMSYCAIGRKYNVSDNAIRKWVKSYSKV